MLTAFDDIEQICKSNVCTVNESDGKIERHIATIIFLRWTKSREWETSIYTYVVSVRLACHISYIFFFYKRYIFISVSFINCYTYTNARIVSGIFDERYLYRDYDVINFTFKFQCNIQIVRVSLHLFLKIISPSMFANIDDKYIFRLKCAIKIIEEKKKVKIFLNLQNDSEAYLYLYARF